MVSLAWPGTVDATTPRPASATLVATPMIQPTLADQSLLLSDAVEVASALIQCPQAKDAHATDNNKNQNNLPKQSPIGPEDSRELHEPLRDNAACATELNQEELERLSLRGQNASLLRRQHDPHSWTYATGALLHKRADYAGHVPPSNGLCPRAK